MTWCCMQEVTLILQVWWDVFLSTRSGIGSCRFGFERRPKSRQPKIWKNQCSLLLVVVGFFSSAVGLKCWMRGKIWQNQKYGKQSIWWPSEWGRGGCTTSESDRLDEIQRAQGHTSEPAFVFEFAVEIGQLELSWRHSEFVMLPKSGNLSETNNWRPIAILKITYKIFSSLLHLRLRRQLDYQQSMDQVTPVVCFAAGHRTILKKHLNKIDVTFRKLLRSVVGPPAATDWSRPWHEILHDWNARVVQFVEQYSVKPWSVRCLEMHWKLAHYAANLPPDRWLARILTWTCRGHQGTGRPRNTWDTMIQKFCRYQHLGIWLDVARDANRWSNLMPHFVTFCAQAWRRRSEGHCNVQSVALFFLFSPVPFTGCLRAYRFHFTSMDQVGFRPKTGVDHAFVVLEAIIGKTLEWQCGIWFASLDLRKAFDKVEHGALFAALTAQGIRDGYLDLGEGQACTPMASPF